APQRIGVEGRHVRSSRQARPLWHANGPNGQRVADQPDAQFSEELASNSPQRDAGSGLPGTGPFEDVSCLLETVFLHADKVCMARAGPGEGRPPTLRKRCWVYR